MKCKIQAGYFKLIELSYYSSLPLQLVRVRDFDVANPMLMDISAVGEVKTNPSVLGAEALTFSPQEYSAPHPPRNFHLAALESFAEPVGDGSDVTRRVTSCDRLGSFRTAS